MLKDLPTCLNKIREDWQGMPRVDPEVDNLTVGHRVKIFPSF